MRLAPRASSHLAALALSTALLGGCSAMGALTGAVDDKPAGAPPPAQPRTATFADDVDGNVRHAKLLRIAGNYDEAIKILSQLMLVAPDDPRVTAEYGKTLAQKGRASDAVQFLHRAIELSPTDWTLYSAMGVAYDQIGDAPNARAAYEHALALKPDEAGVLNNYALSRMLAKDPGGAKALIARAKAAGGGADTDKIARNLELINQMAPEAGTPAAAPVAVAAAKSAPAKTAAASPSAGFQPAPKLASVAPASAEPASKPDQAPRTAGDVARLLASQPVANGAPRALIARPVASAPIPVVETPPAALAAVQSSTEAPAVPSGVVMQAVPYDPYAGPVAKRSSKPQGHAKTVAKAAAPRPFQPASTDDKPVVEAASKSPEKTQPKKTAAKGSAVPNLRVAADHY